MSIISEIYDGWKNLVFENPEVEKLAKERINVCVKNQCRKFTRVKTCAVCGCYMPAKVRSVKSKCPLRKW